MNRKLPKFYSETQMIELASLPCPKTRQGARDRAILGLLCAAGLRASELCAVQVRDVSSSPVFVRAGKFGAERWVPITRRCWLAIQRYLAFHPAPATAPLFRSSNNRALSRRHLHKIVTGYSRSLKLRGGVHTLRHSAATRWLNRGIDLQSVRVMLGHLHITSTAIYLGVALDKLVRKYQLCLEGAPSGADHR